MHDAAGRYRIDPRIHPSETEFLRASLDGGGWSPISEDGWAAGDDWNLFWSDEMHDPIVYRSLGDTQLVNHFPGIAPLYFKDELAHFLQLAGHTFHPTTFSMPHERDLLIAAMRAESGALWIKKMKRWMGGEGMAFVTAEEQIPRDASWIVQRYIANPLLLPGEPYKHTFRCYVVVTSLDPLAAAVYPNGPVKFTSRPFSISTAALRDPVVHFTNPAVQRANTDIADPVRSIDHDQYRDLLRAAGIDGDELFTRVHTMLAATLTALLPPVLELSRQWSTRLDRCFELLGFDIMVDDELNPWLLECNISPALGVRGREGSTHREAQRQAKAPMVRDMLRLVGALDGAHRFAPLVRASSGRHQGRRSDRSGPRASSSA